MTASIEDLASLCSGTLDLYLYRPHGNARITFIQIDDLVELALKSWLQVNVKGWTHIDHAKPDGTEFFKGFRKVVQEVRGAATLPPEIDELLNAVEARRNVRNRFFHDHNQTGLTVDDRRVLEAIRDMLNLLEKLFPNMKPLLCRYATEHAQYKLIRMRIHALHDAGVSELLRRFFQSYLRRHPESTRIGRAGRRVISHGDASVSYEWLSTMQDGVAVIEECRRIATELELPL